MTTDFPKAPPDLSDLSAKVTALEIVLEMLVVDHLADAIDRSSGNR
jgi:hypothetical protein